MHCKVWLFRSIQTTTSGELKFSICSISIRTSVFSAGVSHLLCVTCVAFPLQDNQAWFSSESWFINGETQMEPNRCHIWPLVSNRAEDFLLPWFQWVVVSLSFCCAYRVRWHGHVFPNLYRHPQFLIVVGQSMLMYDEACKVGRSAPRMMLAGKLHPQQLLN